MVEQVFQRAQRSPPITQDTNLLVPNQNPTQAPDELSFINFDDVSAKFDPDVNENIPPAAMQQVSIMEPEGANTPTAAGISSRGRLHKLSRAMQELISQRDFYGNKGMHYMASQAIYDYAQSHDNHMSLQECMRHLVAFHAEMMGDIMHLHQALRQPDAPQFIQAVVHEINGHIKNDY